MQGGQNARGLAPTIITTHKPQLFAHMLLCSNNNTTAHAVQQGASDIGAVLESQNTAALASTGEVGKSNIGLDPNSLRAEA